VELPNEDVAIECGWGAYYLGIPLEITKKIAEILRSKHIVSPISLSQLIYSYMMSETEIAHDKNKLGQLEGFTQQIEE
tara:strand:- start:1413 stop:1646 length:234 start_codon:yes stop_codon:yes gene_type:complete